MKKPADRDLHVFAPAKINLYLHLSGRRDDGYHTLDSLIAFADVGDRIRIRAAQDFKFSVSGPFSKSFGPKETDQSPHSANLVVQAAWAAAQMMQKTLNAEVILEKNLPLASGMGGGSADAAAIIWGLLEFWGIKPRPQDKPGLHALMVRLGADVPVCFSCLPARVRGIGDQIAAAPLMPEIPLVLVNPMRACRTADVFASHAAAFREDIAVPERLETPDKLVSFLLQTRNDLEDAAIELVPEIRNVLNALRAEPCLLARMTGSGATCFGLFATEKEAQDAARRMSEDNPDWWIQSGWLGRPARY